MRDKIIVTTHDELIFLIEDSVRKILSEKSEIKHNESSTLLLSLKEASEFLKLAPQTIYGFTSKRLIPFIKRGKKLYFKKNELEEWLDEGKKKSLAELNKEFKLNGNIKL
ncbi:helix-turn-helix domain-containing protein [Cytophaga hutchinsonii]|uniref:Excisionase n=1 Tax=Cytophaga hutchinsonii (strain ATCC 33406 / DSM 1761 / CIP 103989 / NBRC 15051 / NCIMB 9469 / D465) TaxID=269798 RepID=A0A6N4SR11_CYTH3|nr:helix-turn-helix domain-containing protein [Cytophaga hutchinsonii]ABG58734.1 excisionase [Cytophaga hutchinsonii ATCC 33406]SFX60681.1 DNA binding domain-containing protein, excisionase family [Cytophaga hutchinsonii ATCC 33406]